MAKFRHYLMGHFFIVRTDRKGLKHLSEQTIQTPEHEARLPKLLGFNYSIEYKPGKSNQTADALSRSFHMAVTLPQIELIKEIRAAVSTAEEIKELMQKFTEQPQEMVDYKLLDGLL